MDASRRGARGRARITVASNLRLLGEAVAAALEDGGFDVTLQPWPRAGVASSGIDGGTARMAVIVCDPPDERAVEGVATLLKDPHGPALVVAGPRPGPIWGAMLESGADAVVASTTSIQDLIAAIELIRAGEPLMGVVERQALLRAWFADRADRRAMQEQVARLTPREREVLDLLHGGQPVTSIAARLGVTESTVRSQIRSLLRKLGVRTQLAAVAIVEVARNGPSGAAR